jgi:poly-beta-1,6-N-acetyl-D-glucosamine biosynthesis protein PgaD
MSGSPIIDARDRLPWHRRLWSEASTFLMWGAWLKLWFPVLRSLARSADFGVLHRVSHLALSSAGSAHDLPRYAFALAGTSGTLLLWNRLPAVKVTSPEPRSDGDYARHFAIDERELESGRASSICVVHHDASGRVVRIERRA